MELSRLDRLTRRLDGVDSRAALVLAVAVLAIPVAFVVLVPHPLEQPFGVDFLLYRDATARWLGGGPFYEPHQLAGPYEIRAGDILYPPVSIWLFGPWALARGLGAVAPAIGVLWWLIPIGATASAVLRLRPKAWTWPLIALCATNPTVLLKIWTGNPVMWSMAALALAVVGSSRFSAPFVLLKPSLAPFGLFGIRRRSWWAGLAALGLLAIPFGGLWLDWLASVGNSRGGGILYSALEIPFLLVPLIAWLGRTKAG